MKTIHADKEESNFPPAERVVRTLREVDTELYRRYEKESPLREKLREKHTLPVEQIFISTGGIGVIHKIMENLRSSTRILLPDLGYPYYEHLAIQKCAKIEKFKFVRKKNTWEYDIRDVLGKLGKKPDILVLIDPESPLGFSLTEDALKRILSATDKNTLIILDQAHEGYRSVKKNVTKLVKEHDNLLILRSFSKYYGLAGARIGYAICGKRVKGMIRYTEQYLSLSNISQALAIAALESEDHYRNNATNTIEQRERLYNVANAIPGITAFRTDTASVIIELSEEGKDILHRLAKKCDILLRDLESYHKKLKGFHRLTVGPKDETDRLIDLLITVSWLESVPVKTQTAQALSTPGGEGYSVHRKEWDFAQLGFRIGWYRVAIPPGGKVSAHMHKQQEEIFIFHSDAEIELDGKTTHVQDGDVVYVKPGQMHSIHAPSDRHARFIAQRFPYSLKDKITPTGKQKVHKE